MALIVCWIFAGPRGIDPFPVPVALTVMGTTIYALIVLGRRFPWFGFFLLAFISGLFSRRRGRRW
jgi:hypothetical protein